MIGYTFKILLSIFSIALFLSTSLGSDIVPLTDATFDGTIESTTFVLVKFFAAWCGHCKNMAQDYEDLAKAYKIHSKNLIIAELDGDNNPESIKKYNIEGYPTLYLFKKGSSPVSLPPTTPRTFDGLSEFLHQETGLKIAPRLSTSNVVILNSENFDSTVKDKCSFIKFFTPWCGHCKNMAQDYEKLASVFKAEPNVVIGKINCDDYRDTCTRFSVAGYPTLKLFKESPEDYTGSRDLKSLVSYINQECGTHRNFDGSLLETFARSDELDGLISKFIKISDVKEQKNLLVKVDDLLKKLPYPEHTKFYSTYMNRILEKGIQYAKTELERIEGILSKPESLSDSKNLDSFTVRKNILRLFTGQLSSSSKPDHEEL